MGYDWYYYAKKAYSLYPGIVRPVSAAALEAHYRRRRSRRSRARALLDAVTGLLFHLWIPWRARQVQKRHGFDPAWRRRTIAVAHAAFADPAEVALYDLEDAEGFRTCIRRFEDAALNKLINPHAWTRDCALADKHRFAQRCESAGLPHPPTMALLERGRTRIFRDPAGRELLAKPADGEGGIGVQLLGAVADAAALATRLAGMRTGRSTMIVQPRMPTHPVLRDLGLAALPTIRLVTIKDEQGRPEVVSATLRFPIDPAAHVDNVKSGGLIAPVALDSGRLGLACRGQGGGDFTHHPVNGATIVDLQLPDWEAARSLALHAHGVFSEYVLIGWDVALTPEGPILIEGNGKPGLLTRQRAARAGAAQGRFGALLAHHLEAVSSH